MKKQHSEFSSLGPFVCQLNKMKDFKKKAFVRYQMAAFIQCSTNGRSIIVKINVTPRNVEYIPSVTRGRFTGS